MGGVKVFFSNLGCKLNQAELEDLARRFHAAGHEISPALEEADLHVVNTCTVTAAAARDSRKLARRGQRLRHELRTVLTGCWSAAEPAAAARLAGVDLVVPNDDKESLLDLVHERFGAPAVAPRPKLDLELPYVPLAFGNARALVKVEDGCNMRCSFCIIPSTRGHQRSRPVGEVVREVEALVRSGFHEVVVTGVQISSYRSGRERLADLTAQLLDRTSVGRLRLTSIAPWDFDPRLLTLVAGGRVCRHFHFSLQSGSARTLSRMRRPYSPEGFAELLRSVRAAVPGVAITTDVIVGFPGETEEEFEESLSFVDSCAFARIHAFPFSPRAGTEAAGLADPVHAATVRERMGRMLSLAREADAAFRRSRLGEAAEVLWESRRGDSWHGTTDHYVRVTLPADGLERSGRTARVRLEALDGERVTARELEVAPPFPSRIAAAGARR